MSGQARRARRWLFRRSRVRCHYCRRWLASRRATIDHAIPKSRGGTYDLENLRRACGECNKRKGSKTAVEFFDEMERSA